MSKMIISYKNDTNAESDFARQPSYLKFNNLQLRHGYYRLHVKVKSGKPVFHTNLELYRNGNKLETFNISQPNFCWTRSLIYIKNIADKIYFYPALNQNEYSLYCFELIQLDFIDLLIIGYKRFFWNLSIKSLFPKLFYSLKYLLPSFKPRIYNLIQTQMGCSLKNLAYSEWIRKREAKETRSTGEIKKTAKRFQKKPLISIIMPVYNTKPAVLIQAIESVIKQIYTNWELCICDDCSKSPEIHAILDKYKKADDRIKIVQNSCNIGIASSSNNALNLATGEYCALMDHDDLIRDIALYEAVKIINDNPECLFIYSDEDKIDDTRRRFCPYFKPEWDPYLLLSQNYLNHLTILKRDRLKNIGGWRKGFDGAQDYDLYLRYLNGIDNKKINHIPKVLYHWRAAENSTALSIDEKKDVLQTQIKVINNYLKENKLAGKAVFNKNCVHPKIEWEIPGKKPLVSIIIPVKDQLEHTQKCIDSILQRTDYKNYEIIIIDNESKSSTAEYLKSLQNKHSNINVLNYNKVFNYSAINNYAVACSKGKLLCFMNNDIEIINKDWLEEMVAYGVKPDTGCVGAKLFYPDDTIQHAGVTLGIGGVAGHTHKYFEKNSPGYFNYLQITRTVSAVTAALMLVKKSVFLEVGGFDEENLKVAFNDIDVCLKIMKAGYKNIFTPFAQAYHYESKSRGYQDTPEKQERELRERKHILSKWEKILLNDPFYSPNLSLIKENYSFK